MYESIVGEAHNSPTVWNRYARYNQCIDDLPKTFASLDAKVIKTKPSPIMINPSAIFNIEEQIIPLFFR